MYSQFIKKYILIVLLILLYTITYAQKKFNPEDFILITKNKGLSESLTVFKPDMKKQFTIDGKNHTIGAGFQPSVILDPNGVIHIFFQARLDTPDDQSEKMIAHIQSSNGGKSFTNIQFVHKIPMQTYAISSFIHNSPKGKPRISLLTSLSIDETVRKWKDPDLIKKKLHIDINRFQRKAATLVLEYYSDDLGITWQRIEHYGISDKVYNRNEKDFYLAFINLIGQIRKIKQGKYKDRLILAGPIRGDYLPVEDYPKFRNYRPSSSLIYSDDNGKTWEFGGIIKDSTAFSNNEASAVPINQGKQILMVQRSNYKGVKEKTMHVSNDGGMNWEEGFTGNIPSNRCLQVLESTDNLVLCSTPSKTNRSAGSIFYSNDNGKTWTPRLIEKKAFSYSTVNHLFEDFYICVYSRGFHGAFGINMKIFTLDWLLKE